MENNRTHEILYNSPTWGVLIYVVEHPDQPVRGSRLTKALPHISKSAIYNAIQLLKEADILVKEKGDEAYTLNRDSIGLGLLMRFHNVTLFKPLINGVCDLSSKVILFGSRVTDDYNSDSDYDLLVVTSHATDVRRIINKNRLANRIQLIVKTPEEWIDLNQQNPELYQSIQQGIVLWDRK
jgi:predicted nucleotidyltransferase